MSVAEPVDFEERDSDYVNSLARGLTVISAFTRQHSAMTLSEVAKRTGINRAAARRFLLTLVREGYAETDGKYFRLRPKILQLGMSALASMTFAEVAQPVMDMLADAVDEMCLSAVLDGDWVVYIGRTSRDRVVSVNLDVGSRLPAFCMSTGRVLLAALSDGELDQWLKQLKPVRYTEHTIVSKRKLRDEILRVRSDGYSIMDEEYEIGFRSLSVPIVDHLGRTVSALNICCPSPRVARDRMAEEFLPKALAAAEEIGKALPPGVEATRDTSPRRPVRR